MDNARLVIIRGLPGSGKSTLAREIAQRCGFVHVENDMYFETEQGYQYDASKLFNAIRWCSGRVKELLASGERVVVSNTFIRLEHMKELRELTPETVIIECTADYGNIHGVLPERVAQMRSDWQPCPTAIRL